MRQNKPSLLTSLKASDYPVFFLSLIILIFLPISKAGTPLWITGIFLNFIFAGLAIWSFSHLNISHGTTRQTAVSPFLFALLGLAGLALFQLIPFPISIYEKYSFFRYETLLKFLPSYVHEYPLSLSPWLTFQAFLKWAGYAAFYFLILNTVNTEKRLRLLIFVIIAMGFFEALYGIMVHYGHAPGIYFWKNPYTGDRSNQSALTGTFVNRNHYCSFLVLVFWMTMGALLDWAREEWRTSISWREKILQLFSERMSKILLLFLIPGCIGLVIFLTGSRGGAINFCTALFFFLILIFFKRKRKVKTWLFLLGMICAGCFSFTYFGGKTWISSLVQSPAFQEAFTGESGRWTNWKDTLTMGSNFSVAGAGLGTFKDVYPQFQTQIQRYWDEAGSDMLIDHSHNDFLELFSEGGILGITLFLTGLFLVLAHSSIGKDYKNRHYFLRLCSISAAIGFMSHSIFDFNMHIPANMAYFLVVISLCDIGANRQNRFSMKSWLAAGSIVFSLWGIFFSYRMTREDLTLRNIENRLTEKLTKESTHEITDLLKKAESHFPGNGKFWYYHAQIMKLSYQEEAKKGLYDAGLLKTIHSFLEKSIRSSPANANLHLELGLNWMEKGRIGRGEGTIRDCFRKAFLSFGNAQILAPTKVGIQNKIESSKQKLKSYLKNIKQFA